MEADKPGSAKPLLQSDFNENDPWSSPDGHWMTHMSNQTGHVELWIRRYPSMEGAVKVSEGWTMTLQGATWAPDGRSVNYQVGDSVVTATLDLSGAEARVVSRRATAYLGPGVHAVDYEHRGSNRFLAFRDLSTEQADTSAAAKPKLVVMTNWLSVLKAKMKAGAGAGEGH